MPIPSRLNPLGGYKTLESCYLSKTCQMYMPMSYEDVYVVEGYFPYVEKISGTQQLVAMSPASDPRYILRIGNNIIQWAHNSTGPYTTWTYSPSIRFNIDINSKKATVNGEAKDITITVSERWDTLYIGQWFTGVLGRRFSYLKCYGQDGDLTHHIVPCQFPQGIVLYDKITGTVLKNREDGVITE